MLTARELAEGLLSSLRWFKAWGIPRAQVLAAVDVVWPPGEASE